LRFQPHEVSSNSLEDYATALRARRRYRDRYLTTHYVVAVRAHPPLAPHAIFAGEDRIGRAKSPYDIFLVHAQNVVSAEGAHNYPSWLSNVPHSRDPSPQTPTI